MTLDLASSPSVCTGDGGDQFKYDRVGSWKWIKLPAGTATKKRTRKEGKIGGSTIFALCFHNYGDACVNSFRGGVDAAPQDTLYLTTSITCASPPHNPVLSCASCQAREVRTYTHIYLLSIKFKFKFVG